MGCEDRGRFILFFRRFILEYLPFKTTLRYRQSCRGGGRGGGGGRGSQRKSLCGSSLEGNEDSGGDDVGRSPKVSLGKGEIWFLPTLEKGEFYFKRIHRNDS